ncbi:HNH endonuclease signature motif containing protein [Nocardia sp. KC 131]|uniref:HNH endonuclease signature motif containing protein n=1 Tax=Nocardia arseniciresistens TaxID=3392119 RepID=UPI00398F5B36
MTGRQPIPASLARELMLESGYRCAVPTCRTVEPLDIEHIDEYATVKKHEFSNMIERTSITTHDSSIVVTWR